MKFKIIATVIVIVIVLIAIVVGSGLRNQAAADPQPTEQPQQ